MIKFRYASEKTNSFRPTPWSWSNEPFGAYRGKGARYTAFLAVSKGYKPTINELELVDTTPSRLIITEEKKTLLLIPAAKDADERIMLLTLRGGFRGFFSRIEACEAEILFKRGGNIHCCPTEHLVVRLNSESAYVFSETGRRCGTGLVEVFLWDEYLTMPTEEFEIWRTQR